MSYDLPPAPETKTPRDTRAGNAHCICGSRRKYRKCCGAPPPLFIDELPPLDPPLRLPEPPVEYTAGAGVVMLDVFQPTSCIEVFRAACVPEPAPLLMVHPLDVERWPELRDDPSVRVLPLVLPRAKVTDLPIFGLVMPRGYDT